MASVIGIVAAVAALASLAMLVVLQRRLSSLEEAVSRPPSPPAPAPAPTAPTGVVATDQAWERRLQVATRRLEDTLVALDLVEARLSAHAAAPVPAPAAPPPPPSHAPTMPATSPPVPPNERPAVRAWTPPLVEAASPSPAEPGIAPRQEPWDAGSGPEPVPVRPATDADAPSSDDGSAPSLQAEPVPADPTRSGEQGADMMAEFRDLIAHPRRGEITRWLDDHGGIGCEVADGGGLALAGREAGTLLVLLPLSATQGIVVPSGRMVADFPTSFTDPMSVRPTTRDAFRLEVDGSGLLRVAMPATALLSDGRWRIAAPGVLSGFAAG